jgi:selT/selW/selH-like putative selenoprotein
MLTARDLFNGVAVKQSDESEMYADAEDGSEAYEMKPNNRHKEIPVTGFNRKSTLTINTVNILYCSSCGYKKAFEEVTQLINQKYPDIAVSGANYPSPLINSYLNQLIGIAKMVLIGLILSNINPFTYLGQPTPGFWNWMTTNRMMGVMMTFFISNAIQTQLSSTGAFELTFNNIPIWSKIETGRMPQPGELIQIIDSHYSFEPVTHTF